MTSPSHYRNDLTLDLDVDVLPPCHYLQLQPPSPPLMPWQAPPMPVYPRLHRNQPLMLPSPEEHNQTSTPLIRPTPTYAISKQCFTQDAIHKSSRFFQCLGLASLICGVATLLAALSAEAMNLSIHSISMLIVAVYCSYMLVMLKICQGKASRITTFRKHSIDMLHCLLFVMFLCFLLGGLFFASITNLVRGSQVKGNHTGRTFGATITVLYAIGLGVAYVLVCKFNPVASFRKVEKRIDSTCSQLKEPIRAKMFQVKEMGVLLRRNMQHIHPGSRRSLIIAFLLQSTIAFIANLVIITNEETKDLDGVFSIIFVIFPIFAVTNFLQDVLKNLTEGVLKGIDFGEIAETLLSVSGVVAVRQLRIWSISMDKISLSAHLAIDENANSNAVLSNVAYLLKAHYDIYAYDLENDLNDITVTKHPNTNERKLQRPYSWLWLGERFRKIIILLSNNHSCRSYM